MARSRLAVLVLVGLACVSAAERVRDGYFPGRSPAVVLDSGFVRDVRHSMATGSSALSTGASSLYEVASSITSPFGVGAGAAPELSRELPRAALVMVMDGLDTAAVDTGLAALHQHSQQGSTITDGSFPQSCVTLSTSIATGKSPAVHGVVGESWMSGGKLRNAYNFPTGATSSVVANVADSFSHAFGGRPLVVSASSSLGMASAFSPHLRNAHQLTVALNGDSFGAVTSSTAAPVASPMDHAVDLTADLSGLAQVNNGKAIVTLGDNSVVELDLSCPAVDAFLSEVAYMKKVPQLLAQGFSAQIEDDTPDLIALSFSTVVTVARHFGTNSKEYKACISVLNQAIHDINEAFLSLYGQRVAKHMVSLGTTPAATELDLDARSWLQHTFPSARILSEEDQPLDSLFFNVKSTLELVELCRTVGDYFANSIYTSHCPALEQMSSERKSSSKMSLLSEEAHAKAQPHLLSDIPTEEEVATYQIVLWLSIILGFTVLAAAYAMAFMDLSQDTLLYSKFNPHWSKRN